MLIAWSAPPAGWIKINTNASVHGTSRLATVGGVLRNSDGEWLVGFASNLGSCTVLAAELWGLCHGLELAWQQGHCLVEAEIDSQLVVSFASERPHANSPLI